MPDRRQAFGVLREIAQNAADRGRLAFAASAKPLMRQRLGFDETALGYSTFRELLADAEAAGFVELKYVLGGDVELTPIKADMPEGAPTAEVARDADDITDDARGRAGRVFLRRDFWQTVVNPGQWWYDPSSDAVLTATSAQAHSDLIEMPDFGDETQRPWVEEFVATLPRLRQEVLAPALAAAPDAAGKTSLLRDQPQTARSRWFDFLSAKVAVRFEEWKSERNLTMRIRMPPRPPRTVAVRAFSAPASRGNAVRASSAPAGRGDAVGGQSGDAVRQRLHQFGPARIAR
jgi:hypothetical protein